MKKAILASALALAGLSAFAADYYVVVPLQGKQELLNGISVSLNNTALPTGLVGVPYQGFDIAQALQVTGDPAYRSTNVGWSVVAGALPAGLVLNKGVITGTPTAAGEQAFSVRATYKTKTGEQAYKILTFAVTVALSTGTLPQGLVGYVYPAYDLKPLLTVSGDPSFNPANVTWSVVSNTLPAGLTLKADGTIAGTPTAAGTGALTARASYKGVNGEQSYQVVTLAITVSLTTATLPQGVVGVAYPTQDLKSLLTVAGDPGYSISNVTWTVVSSTLPAGLTLKSDGTISGTPTTSGAGTLVARAAYRGVNGEQSYQVVALGITVGLATGALPQGVVGVAYPAQDLKSLLTVAGDPSFNPANVTWGVVSSTLPAGLTLKSDGTISGTPTTSGTGTLVARAAYRGVTGEQSYQLVTLNLVVALASASLPEAYVGTSYAYDFRPRVSVTGDPNYNPSSVSFRVAEGSAAPAGLSLGSDGVMAGTPTADSVSYNFSVVAAYKGQDGARQYSVNIRPAFFVFSPIISSATAQYNLRSAAISAGWDGYRPLKATVTINSGVYVGSTSTSDYAFDTGVSFPVGSVLALNNYGFVAGKGGDGGASARQGMAGGPALRVQYAIAINNEGTIAGGGGGGGGSSTAGESNVLAGGAGGGGGQGYGAATGGARDPAISGAQYPYGQDGSNGSLSAPGAGGAGTQSGYYPNQWSAPWYAYSGKGGDGGTWGQPGAASDAGVGASPPPGNPGGAAGYSIVGLSNVTWVKGGQLMGVTQ